MSLLIGVSTGFLINKERCPFLSSEVELRSKTTQLGFRALDLDTDGAYVTASVNKSSSLELDNLDGRFAIAIQPTREMDDNGEVLWKMSHHDLEGVLHSFETDLEGYENLSVRDLQSIGEPFYNHVCTDKSGKVTLACGKQLDIKEGEVNCSFPHCKYSVQLGSRFELRNKAIKTMWNHSAIHILNGDSKAAYPCQLCGVNEEAQEEAEEGCTVSVWQEKNSETVKVMVKCAVMGDFTYNQKASNKSNKSNPSSNVSFRCKEDNCGKVISKMNLMKHYEEDHKKLLNDGDEEDKEARQEYYITDEGETGKRWITKPEQEHMGASAQAKKTKKKGTRTKNGSKN